MTEKHHANFYIRLKRKKNTFGNPENAQRKIQKHRLLNMSDLWGVNAATLQFVHILHTVLYILPWCWMRLLEQDTAS